MHLVFPWHAGESCMEFGLAGQKVQILYDPSLPVYRHYVASAGANIEPYATLYLHQTPPWDDCPCILS